MAERLLTPSVKIAVGILAVFVLPYVVKIGVLVPIVENFFPADPSAVTVRRVIHVALTVLAAAFAIPWMRLHRKEGLTAPITRVFVGTLVILVLPIGIFRGLVEPLFDSIFPDSRLTSALPETIMIGVIVGLYCLLFRAYENRPIHELARSQGARETATGFAVGALVPSLAFGVLMALGVYSVSSANHPSILIPAFISMTWVAVSEELFFRGVVYRITEESWGTHLAIALSALIFAAAHLGNAHASLLSTFSAALGGVVLGLAYSFSGRLWLPIGGHLGWNFAQIFFGIPVSGETEYGSFLEGTLSGPDLLTGGGFGIETSLPLLVILSVTVLLLYMAIVRRGRVIRPYWKSDEAESGAL